MDNIRTQANLLLNLVSDLLKNIEGERSKIDLEKASYIAKVENLEKREKELEDVARKLDDDRNILEKEKVFNREKTDDLTRKKTELDEKLAKVNKFFENK